MGETLRVWWQGRTLREQRLLVVMSALTALILGWLLILRPLDDALAAAKERHGAAVLSVAEARAQAAEIERLRKQAGPRQTRPLNALVGDSASAAGFPVKSLEDVGGGAVRLVLESVRPQAFFAWVAQMERQGLIAVEMTARPNTDKTLAAEVTFRMRGV